MSNTYYGDGFGIGGAGSQARTDNGQNKRMLALAAKRKAITTKRLQTVGKNTTTSGTPNAIDATVQAQRDKTITGYKAYIAQNSNADGTLNWAAGSLVDNMLDNPQNRYADGTLMSQGNSVEEHIRRNEAVQSLTDKKRITATGYGFFDPPESLIENLEATDLKIIPTQSTLGLNIQEMKYYGPEADELHTSNQRRLTYSAALLRHRTANADSSDVWMQIIDDLHNKESSSIDVNAIVGKQSQFAPKPKPAIREPRPTWATLQHALRNRIIPNELYEDADGEYELTAYNITIFMLDEHTVFQFGKTNGAASRIKNIKQVEEMGGIVVVQTAGTDEFYIENMSYKTGVGGGNLMHLAIEFSVKSPYQADFVDHLFKTAKMLKVRNWDDFPLYMLIEWKGRNAKDSKPKKFSTSRCYPFLFRNMSLTLDESGGTYSIEAYRASERGLGQDKIYLKKDITVSGETVGEILGTVVTRLNSAIVREELNVWVADRYAIEIPVEWAAWEVKSAYEKKHSPVTNNNNGALDQSKSVVDQQSYVNKANMTPNEMEMLADAFRAKGHANSANAAPVSKFESQKFLNQSEAERTFTWKTGTDLYKIINDVLNTAFQYQLLVVGNAFNPQAADAVGSRSEPENIFKYCAKIDVDVQYIGYDKNTRQYACKRIFEVVQNHDPILGADENTTIQTKASSEKRLYDMLGAGLIEKVYTYFYTGLNTEVKNLEFSFDRHYVLAKGMVSEKGASGKRFTGVTADAESGIAEGPTSEIFQNTHDNYRQHIGALRADIIEIDAVLTSQSGFLVAGSTQNKAALEGKLRATEARKKVKTKELKKAEQYENVTAAQVAAVKAGELIPTLESTHINDKDKLVMEAGGIEGSTYFKTRTQKLAVPDYLRYMGDLQMKSLEGPLFPVKFSNTRVSVKKTGTNEEAHQGGNIIARQIANRIGAQMNTIELEIRGDPHWLPTTFTENNKDSISPASRQPMLIVIASQSSDYNGAGILQVNERNSLSAVYNVMSVVHTFSGGEFSQVLNCVRDTQIDINAVLRAPDTAIYYNEFYDENGFGPSIGGT